MRNTICTSIALSLGYEFVTTLLQIISKSTISLVINFNNADVSGLHELNERIHYHEGISVTIIYFEQPFSLKLLRI